MLDVYINWSKYDSQCLPSQRDIHSDGEQVAHSLITFIHVSLASERSGGQHKRCETAPDSSPLVVKTDPDKSGSGKRVVRARL